MEYLLIAAIVLWIPSALVGYILGVRKFGWRVWVFQDPLRIIGVLMGGPFSLYRIIVAAHR